MAYDFKKFKENLKQAEDWLKLDAVQVDAYGSKMPINQIANVSIEDARVLRIAPYDKSISKDIEKAITASSLGLSVIVDDKGMRVFFPELTGERRAAIIKTAKEKLENTKKNVRSAREETMKDIESKEKEGEMSEDDKLRYRKEAQKFVDDTNKNLEVLFEKKEKEINS